MMRVKLTTPEEMVTIRAYIIFFEGGAYMSRPAVKVRNPDTPAPLALLSGGSGVIPEPTVKVWMGEDQKVRVVLLIRA